MAAAVSLALVVSAVAAGCGSTAPAPPTAQVERGQVSTKVSASGALAAVTSQGMAFPKAAQLTQLLVKVGDTVQPGQVLAREDNFAFNQSLNQLRGTLNQQQAQLDRLVRTPLVSGDRRSVEQNRKIVSATESNGRAIHQKDENAVSRARQAVDLAERQLDQAQDAYRYCIATYQPSTVMSTPMSDADVRADGASYCSDDADFDDDAAADAPLEHGRLWQRSWRRRTAPASSAR